MRVVVIGAGVIGLSCALELRRRGADVVLVEQSGIGDGVSSGNAGWVVPVFATPLPAPGVVGTALRGLFKPDSPMSIRLWPDRALLSWLWSFWRHSNAREFAYGVRVLGALAGHAFADFDALLADGIEMEMEERGVLFLVSSNAGAEHLRHEIEVLRAHGYSPLEFLTAEETRQFEPAVNTRVLMGVFAANERHLRPERLIAALAERARQLGVDIQTSRSVVGFKTTADAVEAVVTTREDLGADEFVVCAGAWSRELLKPLGINVPIQAGRGYSITVDEPEIELRRPIYLVEARIACTPLRGSLRLAGTMEFAGIDAPPQRARFDAIRRGANQYLRGWRGRTERERTGARPVTPDGLPLIGRFPTFRNLSIASGHGMVGVTLAPSTGIAIADLLCQNGGRIDLTPFAPGRFH